MPSKVQIKRSNIASKIPVAGDLDYGELAINYADGRLYYKNNANSISALRGDSREFNVTSPFGGTYTIDGASGNPTITLLRGFTYTFNIAAAGHPFWIKTAPTTGTGNQYNWYR